MRLVERHGSSRADPRFPATDAAAFASQHLYHQALDLTRQAFFQEGTLPRYPLLSHPLKGEPEEAALPHNVAQSVLKQVCAAWASYQEAWAADETTPTACGGWPRLPRDHDKPHGRHRLGDTRQALSQPARLHQQSCPAGLSSTVQTRQRNCQQVRLVPRTRGTRTRVPRTRVPRTRGGGYLVEGLYERMPILVEGLYERAPIPAAVNPALAAGRAVGLNNLALLPSTNAGFVPRLVHGRPVKSINQLDNKGRAALQRRLGGAHTSRRLEQIPPKRPRRMDGYLHTASRRLIELRAAAGSGTPGSGTPGSGTPGSGKAPLWKQPAHRGKRTKQNCVAVPLARCSALLTYQAELVGSQVTRTEERYTSQASFLDWDPLPVYGDQDLPAFSGKRVKRGRYRAADGRHSNADADATAASNMQRKVAPDAFAHQAARRHQE
jgi:hypothetical protein